MRHSAARASEHGIADHPALLGGASADQIPDHDKPASDTQPDIQRLWDREPADRVDDCEPGPHRLPG